MNSPTPYYLSVWSGILSGEMLKSFFEVAVDAFRHETSSRRDIEKIDGRLTDNMRALRLTATMADWLLSLGVAASDVTHVALNITKVYCSRKVHVDIIHTILFISMDRGDESEPLTITRTISPRGNDYSKIQKLQQLNDRIQNGELSLEDAERSLDKIISRGRLYPRWITHVAMGLLSGGVMMMYSHDPVIWIAAFFMGAFVNLSLYWLKKMGIPTFYSQAIAGFLVVIFAAFMSYLASNEIIPVFGTRDPTFIVVGGIVLLVAGMMITSAFQDAIDEYYVTASSRLLKVAMVTGGIVFGATVGLYLASKFGITLATTPDRLSISTAAHHYIGAFILAGSFALGRQARPISVLGAALAGALSLYVMGIMSGLGLGLIPSSGIAAVVVGLAATLLTNWFRIPSIVVLDAGIIPLVPGLTLYSSVSYLAQSVPNSSDFDLGLGLLVRAILIAVTVAAGATVGNIIGRPAQRRLIHIQNQLPRYYRPTRKKSDTTP